MILFILIGPKVHGQGVWQILTLPDSSLTQEQLLRKTIYSDSARVPSLNIVKIDNAFSAQDSNILPVYLPNHTELYSFKGAYIEQYDSGNYTWHGKLSAIDDQQISPDTFAYGYITLMASDSATFGELIVDTAVYHIRDLTGGLSALIELDIDLYDAQCAMIDDTSNIADNGANDSHSPSGYTVCPVRVGVLFTEGVVPRLPDFEHIASLGVFNTNQILRNSNISEYPLRFVLAGTEILPASHWQQTEFILDDRLTIASNSFVIMQRQLMDADVMVVFTREWGPASGIVTDYGDDASDVDNAFALVAFRYALSPKFTFSHEMFHLFGARHDGKDICFAGESGAPFSFAYGYNWEQGSDFFGTKKYYKTTMAVCPPTLFPRQMHLSNPDVKIANKPTGRVNRNNNARLAREQACRVSSYLTSSETFVTIVGAAEGCPGDIVGIAGVVEGEPPPYTYTWRTTLDGVNWSAPVTSSNSTFMVQLPADPNEYVFIELAAGAVNGPVGTAFKTIYTKDDPNDCSFISTHTSNPDVNDFVIYPNPTEHHFNISSTEEVGELKVSIVDISGKIVYTQSCEAMTESTEIFVGQLGAGLYFVNITTESASRTIPLVVNP